MDLLQQLQTVEALAQSGKWQRLCLSPLRYIQAAVYGRWGYPLLKMPLKRYAHTFFGAKMQVLLPAGADIYLTGGKTHDSEIRLARWMIRHLKPGHQVLDIGAHYGYFTLLAAHLTGTKGQVFCVEAATDTFAILKQNIQAFPFVRAIQAAVSAQNGRFTFFQFPALYSEYNGLNVDIHRSEAWFARFPPVETPVEGITLDELLTREAFEPFFIKIDVEGAEDQVMEGGFHTLQQVKPIIAMEYLAGKYSGEGHKRAVSLLLQAGYQAHCINATGELIPLTDIPAYLRQHNLDSDNVIFIPKNK